MDISAIMDFMVIAEQFFFSPPPQGFDPRSLVTLSYEADAITVRPGCPRATYCEAAALPQSHPTRKLSEIMETLKNVEIHEKLKLHTH